MSEACTLDDVLAVLPPGESCSYVALIDRLKEAGRPTLGVGVVLGRFREDEGFATRSDRHGELRCWMKERWWDEETEGTWIAGEMWVARRQEQA